MLTSRRDYLMRLVDEVTKLLERLIFQRRSGRPEDALQSIVLGFERLFDREADQIFQLTPEQQYLMLGESESPDFARDKRLLYAALSAEAARIYAVLGRDDLARASRLNALRFTLRATRHAPEGSLPDYAPHIPDLVAELGPEGPDPETAALLRDHGTQPD